MTNDFHTQNGEVTGPEAPTFRPQATGSLRAEDLVPYIYLLVIQSQRCDCGAEYQFNQLSLVYAHPRWTSSTKFRKVVPVERRTRPDLKVGTSRLPTKRIALCAACLDTIAQPDDRPAITDRDWAEALAKEARERRATPSAKPGRETTPKPAVNIDNLDL